MNKVTLTINQSFQYQGCRIITQLDPSSPKLVLFVQDTCEDRNYRRYQARRTPGGRWLIPGTNESKWVQDFLDESGHLIGKLY
jgi:hypothetical protein